jgi:hypothetical protein
MRRLAITLLAASIVLGIGVTVGLARTEGGHDDHALEATTAAPQGAATPQQEPAIRVESAKDDEGRAGEAPATAPCDPDAMLPVISKAIQIPYSDMFWDSVKVAECQNGYARVFALTGGTPPPGTQLEGSEQVFLRDVGGEWTTLSSGSGLDCYPGSMPPDLKDACEALDLT